MLCSQDLSTVGHVAEKKPNLVTLKIWDTDKEWVLDEQARLRKAEGQEPIHAEIFNRMKEKYSAGSPLQTAGFTESLTKEKQELVDLILDYFKDVPDGYERNRRNRLLEELRESAAAKKKRIR